MIQNLYAVTVESCRFNQFPNLTESDISNSQVLDSKKTLHEHVAMNSCCCPIIISCYYPISIIIHHCLIVMVQHDQRHGGNCKFNLTDSAQVFFTVLYSISSSWSNLDYQFQGYSFSTIHGNRIKTAIWP